MPVTRSAPYRSFAFPPEHQDKQKNDTDGTEKAEFLTDNGKNHIILCLRHIAQLLQALSESFSKQLAGSDCIECLHGLISLISRCLRMFPCLHTVTPVRRDIDKCENKQHPQHGNHKKLFVLRACHRQQSQE